MAYESTSNTADSRLGEISSAVRAANYERAAALADSILVMGLHHPIVYNARALAFQEKGQFREALVEFNRARALMPNDANLLNAVGACLVALNQPYEAIATFDQALACDPANAQTHYRKGWVLEMLGERGKATDEYERAIAISPDHADSLASLAAAIVPKGRIDEARKMAERALVINPVQPTAKVAMGMVDLAEKKFGSAEIRFRKVLGDTTLTLRARAAVHGLLADALDGQDRIDEAFAHFRFEKNEIYKLYASNYAAQTRPKQATDLIMSFLDRAPAGCWVPVAGSATTEIPRCHVFLLGFSRSGTTLLEQVLASHDDVVASEEQDFLAEAAQSCLADETALRRLVALSPHELDRHRADYWRRVRDAGFEVEGKVFVDKLPLNTIKLPLIAKLFSSAKILFAVRDPRDVLLSCYRRHFEINTAMFEFLTLESAAEFYASVMQLGAECRTKMSFDIHDVRYENVVTDFDNTLHTVCDFIGIDWSIEMRDFHTKRILPVRSPSAAQITRPLNTDSVGRWRDYRQHLAPVLPILRPWVERFDYPAE